MLPNLEELDWNEEKLIEAHARALLARWGYPLPRCAVLNGELVSPFEGKSACDIKRISTSELRSLAGAKSPNEFFKGLIEAKDSSDTSKDDFLTFLRHFGIWPDACGWFKYHSQLR